MWVGGWMEATTLGKKVVKGDQILFEINPGWFK